jgi:hypothetical protein
MSRRIPIKRWILVCHVLMALALFLLQKTARRRGQHDCAARRAHEGGCYSPVAI